MGDKISMNRRDFLKYSAFGAIGAGIPSQGNLSQSEKQAERKSPRIKNYRILGRTGFRVSDISSGMPFNPAVLKAVLDSGVNYIDTSEEYGRGQSERIIGEVIKNRDRKSLFISTKIMLRPYPGMKIPEEGSTKEGILKRVHKCLERLQTDYIDCLMISIAENLEILKSEDFHAAAAQLKEEGKLRFVGVSHHGSEWYVEPEETMEKILLAAVEDGRFDVLLLAYNFLRRNKGEKILEACKQKNIGTTLMKTSPIGDFNKLKAQVARLEGEVEKGLEYQRKMLNTLKAKADLAEGFVKKYRLENAAEIKSAAIRFCLSNPNVNTVCISFQNFDDVKNLIPLSGGRLAQKEKTMLAAYSQGLGSLYCRHACGLCEPKCPHRVPVNTIMRYYHYFAAQGREKFAMGKYAELPTSKADLCSDCEGFCENACPHGVPIHGLLTLAHETLTIHL